MSTIYVLEWYEAADVDSAAAEAGWDLDADGYVGFVMDHMDETTRDFKTPKAAMEFAKMLVENKRDFFGAPRLYEYVPNPNKKTWEDEFICKRIWEVTSLNETIDTAHSWVPDYS